MHFYMAAFGVTVYYFLAAGVQMIGGLVQLCDYSRKSALWSITFGIIALIVGIFLAVYVYVSPPPSGISELLRSVA